jgi:imidazolonepropionase
MKSVDILIKNANEIATLKGANRPRVKREMSNIGLIKNGSIAIDNGKIVGVGKELNFDSEIVINAKGKTVLPGFVDSHTHLVFGGSREFELNWKLNGLSYMDIKERGGGIGYTVAMTRKSSIDSLFLQAKKRLDYMLSYGITTCEAKSGYGLDTESEIKILRVAKRLNEIHPVDIVSTFLGAHDIPFGFNANEYTELIINEMLPKVKDLAIFCDVFCEDGVFNREQSRLILEEGKKHGFIPKIHADEIIDTGGASIAAEVGAISADHCLRVSREGINKMAKEGVIGVLLPATPFSLMIDEFAPAREMINSGVPVALATDLNPNCWVENMQFIIQLGCFKMGLTPAEAITASTFNSACSIGVCNRVGSIEVGKDADIIILDCKNHMFLPYHIGVNLVETVIKKGIIIKNMIS